MEAILGQRWERLYVAAGAAAWIVALFSKLEFPPVYTRAQTARAPALVGLLCDAGAAQLTCPRAQGVIDATRGDDLFVLAYVLLGMVVITCLAGLRTWARTGPRKIGPPGWLAIGLLSAAGVADVLENEFLRSSAVLLQDRVFRGPAMAIAALGDVPDQTVLAATVKWCLVVATLVIVAWTVFGPPLVAARPHPVYNRPPRDPKRPWDPPPATEERLGICCSGGGIRSAAFSLGALQAFRNEPRANPLLGRARYLSAVSGGGYIAAGLVVAEGTSKTHDPPVFSPGSAEERHFRDHSSYLVPDLVKGTLGISRLLIGLFLNLVLVWLVLFLVARPVGWAIGELHPELHSTPLVAMTRDPIAGLRVLGVDPVECTQGAQCDLPGGTRPGAALFAVRLGNADEPPAPPGAPDQQTAAILLDVPPFEPADAVADCSYGVTDRRAPVRDTVEKSGRTPAEDRKAAARPALIAVTGSKAEVVRQPIVEVLVPRDQDARCHDLAATLVVERQPEVSLRSSAVGPAQADLEAEIVVSTQPRIVSETGLRGRDEVKIQSWMWGSLRAVTTVAVVFVVALVALRPSGRFAWAPLRARVRQWFPDDRSRLRAFLQRLGEKRTWLLWPAVAATALDLCLLLLLVVLPLLIQAVPRWLAEATGVVDQAVGSAGSGVQDYLVPGGGALFLAVTALRRYLSGAPDTDDGRTKADSPGVLKRFWRWLSGRSRELSWYELSPAKVLLGVLLLASFLVIFVLHLQYASANGPGGRLMGVALVRDRLSYRWWRPEWQKYLFVLGGLVVFERLVDAHSWSLQPFYKRRLSIAYLEGRRSLHSYDDGPLRFDEIQPEGFPQLVVGCAVNLSEVGRVPPGRRAASFTFSSTEIGGPLVGYVPTETYWRRMRRARQKDITVPGAMAISGAAFSPAMGKKNLGPVGSIMAMANLRLGVWLPHPEYVLASSDASWIDRPGASWFLRELLNRYDFDKPYLYVSDGGHWENLGLVELLRRGCTKIVCVNAGGDSQRAFGTIGEAVALAREELGVEFYDFDPSPLRPPIEAAKEGRLLRREVDRDKAEPLATASFVCGRFRYPAKYHGREGRIWLIEPALTADLPFDVHVFAESEAIFPDDSTADQVFNHRQFEAFRALGHHQAMKVAADPVFVEPAGEAPAG